MSIEPGLGFPYSCLWRMETMEVAKAAEVTDAVGQSPYTEVKYGLFCANTEYEWTPVEMFYTRFAARRKCEELNRRSTEPRWYIRPLIG